MRKTLLLSAVLMAANSPARADETPQPWRSPLERSGPEVLVGLGGGGPVGLSFGGVDDHTTAPVTSYAFMKLRVQSPGFSSPRTLEAYAVPFHGFGVNLKNDDLTIGRVRLHLLDVGVFWNAFEPVSVRRVERSLDVTLGLGVEVRLSGRWSAAADYRAFVPNPFTTLHRYGDFSRLIAYEVFQGGQTWLALSYSLF